MPSYKKVYSFIIFLFLFLTQNFVLAQTKKVIHNPSKGLWEEDSFKKVTIEPLLTLGVEKGDENQEFYRPEAVVVNDSGEIYVLDSGNYRVQKFDKDGHFLMTIGRKGKGPGEFLDSYYMGIDKKGNIYISDNGNSRVEVFSGNGKYLYGFNLPSDPFGIEVDSKGFIYVKLGQLIGGFGKNLLFKFDSKGHLITSFAKTTKDRDKMLMAAKNLITTCMDQDNYIYVSHLFGYRIEKYNTKGNLILEFDRKLPYSIPTPTVTRRTKTSAAVLTPKTVESIACDNHGLIYVLLGGKDKEYMKENGNLIIDVFNSEGQYLTKIPLGRSLINTIYVDSKRNLYLIDSWNQMKVYKYALKFGGK